jgi:hypothetical protein
VDSSYQGIPIPYFPAWREFRGGVPLICDLSGRRREANQTAMFQASQHHHHTLAALFAHASERLC